MPAPITVINPATVHVPPTFSYSDAVRIGDLVFVAGQVAQNARGELVGKNDPRQQTEQVFESFDSCWRRRAPGSTSSARSRC